MGDNDNIVDFDAKKLPHVHKKSDQRAEEMRKAFREARAESSPKPKLKSMKRRRKNSKK